MDTTKPVYNGLHEQIVYYVDTSATSPELFVIKEFPTQLNAGKNLFKLHGHYHNLREDSVLYIEVLDYNGEPIYHELSELSEEDGSVVIAIYITATTPPGNCTITVVGEALYIGNENVPVEWHHQNNIMWQRTVLVNPSKTNTSEIIFKNKPAVTIQEQISVQLDRSYDTTQTVIYNTGSVQLITFNGTPTLIVDNGEFTPDMVGGTVTITSPINPVPSLKYITGSIPFESVIAKVMSTSSIALRSQYLIDPSQSMYGHRYDNFDLSPYSIEYEVTPKYVLTENSESYALIEIDDLQTLSGDVSRIKVFSSNSGTIGTWDLLSDVVLGPTEIFITSTSSIEPYISVGLIKSSSIIDTYYESASYDGFNTSTSPTVIYSNNNLTDALYIDSTRDISLRNNVDIVKLKDQYAGKFTKDGSYKLTLNAIGTRTIATGNTDPIISFYLSGSSFNTDYTDYFNQELPISVGKRIGYLQCKYDEERFDDNTIIFNADYNGTGILYFVVEGGQWEISNIHVETNNNPGYTPSYTRIRTKIPTIHKSGVQQAFKIEYYNSLGVKSEHSTIIDPINWVGGNHYIDGDHNLITGSLFVADKLSTGIEFAGRKNSGIIRTIGYTGWNDKKQGILIWSGSALTGSATEYKGVGAELYADDDNYFRFATDTSETRSLYVKTKTFFLGNSTSSISADGSNVRLSGSILFDNIIVPTASYAFTASYVTLAQTASYFFTSSVTSASFATNSATASYFITSSVTNASTASYLNTINQDLTFNGNLTLNGTASITYLTVTYESASVIFSSGSNQFGDALDDVQTLNGIVKISGSLNLTGSANIPSITGSLFGTASWSNNAVTASYFFTSSVTSASFAQTASSVNILNQNVSITGSLNVSSSITASAFVTNDALITSTTLTANAGITTIYSIPTASYDGAWFDYTIRSGSNARAGTIFGLWSGSAVNYAETTTTDFGSTANFTFGMSINGSNMILSSSTTTNGWTVNSIIRSI